jgi:hypothetical protein
MNAIQNRAVNLANEIERNETIISDEPKAEKPIVEAK